MPSLLMRWAYRQHAGHPLRMWYDADDDGRVRISTNVYDAYLWKYRDLTLRRGRWYVYHRIFAYPKWVLRHAMFRDRLAKSFATIAGLPETKETVYYDPVFQYGH